LIARRRLGSRSCTCASFTAALSYTSQRIRGLKGLYIGFLRVATVGVSFHSSEDGNRSSVRNIVFLVI
jgi:hypothetical protein